VTDPNVAYLGLLLGGIGIAHTIHAVATGKNMINSADLDRANKPAMFWLATGLEGAMSIGLIRLSAQILGWF
jgi:hypothetical protein